MTREEVEALYADGGFRVRDHAALMETMRSLFDRVAELEQEVARMREVLEPFAAEAEA